MVRQTRRQFLGTSAALLAAGATTRGFALDNAPRPKIAIVLTACFYRSHAHVLLENFLEPYLFCGQLKQPAVEVVALYAAQFNDNDTLRRIAKDYSIPLYPSIAEAICRGGQELAVDGVVSIGEHGEYPENELGQQLYPRKEFFDQIVAVFRKSGRSVPVFNDKHLSYRFDWAKEMVDVSRELKFPLLAGSSVPLSQRVPDVSLPPGAAIEEAVSIHGGPTERYGYHALEVLQAIVEDRAGGETGVSSVTYLTADQMRGDEGRGRWSPELAVAAMKAEYELNGIQPPADPLAELKEGFLIEYSDGTKGTVLKVGESGIRWNFACRLKAEVHPRAFSHYVGPWNNRSLFRALANAIQVMIVEKRAPYPVERILMSSGMTEAIMQSKFHKAPQKTPQLQFTYKPMDWERVRENGETWKTITPDTPEPEYMKKDPEPKGV
ncbi:hypothetical protein Pan44_00640 [Caulifigura coniformis]|uniref:Uncharacterized protein n=1 Tax=Caulifigura coniformis TaxID=2527983 RepID=A0A517S7F3_9PLAN|nr:hypothetical protein [Caulifigura coniformis]QDT52056.1 hypothetical protein Pan44_00640 [Caulifigura coniformis]